MWNQAGNYVFKKPSISLNYHCHQLTSHEAFNALHLSISQLLSQLNTFDEIYLAYRNGGESI
jgi:hypothetical protein